MIKVIGAPSFLLLIIRCVQVYHFNVVCHSLLYSSSKQFLGPILRMSTFFFFFFFFRLCVMFYLIHSFPAIDIKFPGVHKIISPFVIEKRIFPYTLWTRFFSLRVSLVDNRGQLLIMA